MGRRVVITGLGAVAPGGPTTTEFWDLLTSGRTATRTITQFDASRFRSRIAAEVDFNPLDHGFTPAEITRLDRAALFAVSATRQALADSGLDRTALAAERTAVAFGNAVGCTTSMEKEYVAVSDEGRLWEVDPSRAIGHLYSQFVPSSIAKEVAQAVGAKGPVALISDGCTSGLDALGYAADLIREGSADVVISGGTEAPISPITLACFDAIKATSPRNDEPGTASRPFDISRNGLVLGEGAGAFVLEELQSARRRGARIYAEVAGFATRCNAYHMTGLRADGNEMAEAIRRALHEAKLNPSDIGYVNAHGSSTKQNDRHETAAVKQSLGAHAYDTPMSSIKSMIGHSLGAIGALEIVACALTIENGVIPPTANLTDVDPDCDLDYVPVHAREQRVDAVLNIGSGFGGFQSAVVLARAGGKS